MASIFFGKLAMNMIRDLAKKLTAFDDFVGSVVAELEFRRGNFTAGADVVKIHSAMAIIKACTSQEELLVKLIRPRSEISPALGCRIQSSEKIWRVFTASEVFEFVEDVGDKNQIHRLNPPIVPGLLLLETILECENFSACRYVKLKFKNFITAGEPLTLIKFDAGFEISGAGVRKILISAK